MAQLTNSFRSPRTKFGAPMRPGIALRRPFGLCAQFRFRSRFWANAALPAAVALVIGAVLFSGIGAAAADEDLSVDSTTTFVVNPAQGQLEAQHTFVLRNNKAPVVDDTRTEEFFFTTFAFVLLSDAEDLRIDNDGVALTSTREPVEESPHIEVVRVNLPQRLAYEETVSLDVQYRVPNGEARTDDPVRITDSYVAFPLYVCCDAGMTSLRVEIPDDYDVDFEGRDATFERTELPGRVVFEQDGIEDPATFNAFVFGRNDDRLDISTVDLGGHSVRIEAWPDDPEWASFVTEALREFIPVLERRIGQPWPLVDDLRVVETTTPYLFGYAGWYQHQDAVIEIGELLDERVLVHELTHAWLSDELFASRWINEGLAEYFTDQALREVAAGREGTTASDEAAIASLVPEIPDRGSFFAQPLSTWSRPTGLPTANHEEREAYAYGASAHVVSVIVDAVGEETLREVLAVAESGEISFVAGDEAESDPNAWRSWQRFMDLIEQRGGWDSGELFRSWVATPEEAVTLNVRRDALTQFGELETAQGGWSAPLGVRSAMTTWDFDRAFELMDAAMVVTELRTKIGTAAAGLELPVLAVVQDAYEASLTIDDMDKTTALAERQQTALELVQEAAELAAAPRSWSADLGLRGRDPAESLAAVRAAYEADDLAFITAEVDDLRLVLANAPEGGKRTTLLVGLIAVGLLALLALWIGGRRGRPKPKEPPGAKGPAEDADLLRLDEPDAGRAPPRTRPPASTRR